MANKALHLTATALVFLLMSADRDLTIGLAINGHNGHPCNGLAAACTDCHERADLASLRTEYLELGGRMDFQSQFPGGMMCQEEE